MSTSGGILVIRGGAIGDFILTLPVLAALRERFSEARVEVLGYAHIARLASSGGLADAVRSIEARALASFFARDGQLDPGMAEYFSTFAVIVSYLYDPDQIFQENVQRCSNAHFLAGPHQPELYPGTHAARTLCKPLERLAIYNADPVPRLNIAASGDPAARLAIHAGSGSERKNWPDYKWRDFLPRLSARYAGKFLLVGGEAESSRLSDLAALLPGDRLEVADRLDLVVLAARLKQCQAFLGHDSGISHLAAALQLPTLVLWGTTLETVWRPLGDRVRILKDVAGLRGITVDQALERLEEMLAECGEP